MWTFLLVLSAIVATSPMHRSGTEVFAFPGSIKKLPDLFWNSSNPIFRIDNTDNVIDVNQGNSASNPFEYDQVNIICPLYDRSLTPEEKDAEKFIIYHVKKEEYDTCMITTPRPRIIAQCDSPYSLRFFTISFRSFSPTPGALEFKPGHDYYFISTSAKGDLHRRINGMCHTHNMRVVFKVASKVPAPSPTLGSAVLQPQLRPDPASGRFPPVSLNMPAGEEDYDVDPGILGEDVDEEEYVEQEGPGGQGIRKHWKKKPTHPNLGRKKMSGGKAFQNRRPEDDDEWSEAQLVIDDDQHEVSIGFPPMYNGGSAAGSEDHGRHHGRRGGSRGRGGYDEEWNFAFGHPEGVMNDKPRVKETEPSMVAKVKDLMKQEASVGGVSSSQLGAATHGGGPHLFVKLLLAWAPMVLLVI